MQMCDMGCVMSVQKWAVSLCRSVPGLCGYVIKQMCDVGIVMSVQKCDLGCVVMSLSRCVMWVL